MPDINIYCSDYNGIIRPMHGVNNGPTRVSSYEGRGNFDWFSDLNIPFVRNHDASLSEAYGSQHVVDVHCIFPNFDRDPADPTAYDFKITDYYTETIINTGARVFYRLGASIEHWVNKYGTRKPPDFDKWVDICEHIIMHYTEGWANGFSYDIDYWEIWNEPDLDPDDSKNKRTWGGTKAEFFDLYEVAAKRLKARFPNKKIGGPALAGKEEWADDFLEAMRNRNVPIDFFSWHVYSTDPRMISRKSERIRAIMQKHGYGDAESILNEWNYVSDWTNPLHYLSVIKGLKGASFSCAVMCEMQTKSDAASLMYYDARVEKIWNGLFDSDTLLPIKGYYAFKAFSELYQTGQSVRMEYNDTQIYASAARSTNRVAVLLTNYADEEPAPKQICMKLEGLDAKADRCAEIYTVSETNNLELLEKRPVVDSGIQLTIPAYHIYLVIVDLDT